MRRSALAASVLLIAPLLGATPDESFDRWAETVAADIVRAAPMAATSTQYFSGAEQDALDRQLTPITTEYRQGRVAAARRALEELSRFDRTKLNPDERVSAAIIEWSRRAVVDAAPFSDYAYIYGQLGGLHLSLVHFLVETHPIRNHRDVENYMARLGLVAGQMDAGTALAREQGARGFLMPRFITTVVIAQFDAFLKDAPADNVLVTSLDARAARLPDLSPTERARFVGEAEQIVSSSVLPAFKRAQALLREQLPSTTDRAGLSWQAGGDRAYANALKRHTTTDLTPAEIHALGRREVVRIQQQMDGLLRQLGYVDGTVEQRYAALNLDSQPPATPDPRPALLAHLSEIVRDGEVRAALLFDERPAARVEVVRESPLSETTAPAGYNPPAPDGSRPGVFHVPLPGPVFNILAMRSLAYHEAVPGHHFQIGLQIENHRLPRYRRDGIFATSSAFAEGWGLYAERLATENGWYRGDPKGLLGQLDNELFRAKRLVVDTGLHAMKWTRQQAIDYGIAPAEVDRYVANPGQACAYMIGMLKFVELRGRAQRALGSRFSIKAFHRLILDTGNVPLAVLDQVVDEWIASEQRLPARL